MLNAFFSCCGILSQRSEWVTNSDYISGFVRSSTGSKWNFGQNLISSPQYSCTHGVFHPQAPHKKHNFTGSTATLTLFSRFIPAQKTRPVNLHFLSTIDGILENITTIYLSGTVFHLISPRTSEQPSYITRHLQIYGQFMLSFFFLAILCYLALHYTSVTLCISIVWFP